jgi:hypothetical protein
MRNPTKRVERSPPARSSTPPRGMPAMARTFARSWKYNPATAVLMRGYWGRRCRHVRRFVFVATTGRSGTMTLSDICARAEGCVSLHEPYPKMHEDVLHAAAYGDARYVHFVYRVVKSVNIMRAAAGARTYVETNHQFIKSFCDEVVRDFGERVSVVHLVRDPVDVANSICSLGDQPGTAKGDAWWLDYRAPANHVRIADVLDDGGEFSDPFYRALWYWYEIEARTEAFRRRYPSVPLITFRTEHLGDADRVAGLLRQLSLDAPPDAIRPARVRSNGRMDEKAGRPLPREEADRRHEEFRRMLLERGILREDAARSGRLDQAHFRAPPLPAFGTAECMRGAL